MRQKLLRSTDTALGLVRVCLSGQHFSKKTTFDLDIWCVGSSWHRLHVGQVRRLRSLFRSQFTVVSRKTFHASCEETVGAWRFAGFSSRLVSSITWHFAIRRVQTSWSTVCDSIAASQRPVELRHFVTFVLRTSPLARLLTSYIMMQALQCDFRFQMLLLRWTVVYLLTYLFSRWSLVNWFPPVTPAGV